MRSALNSTNVSLARRSRTPSFSSLRRRRPRFLFDLPGFIGMRVRRRGVGAFKDFGRDTYAEPEQFFSYRRSVHKGEPDYGRQISAIALV